MNVLATSGRFADDHACSSGGGRRLQRQQQHQNGNMRGYAGVQCNSIWNCRSTNAGAGRAKAQFPNFESKLPCMHCGLPASSSILETKNFRANRFLLAYHASAAKGTHPCCRTHTQSFWQIYQSCR
jgi:hypothetical protein